MYFINVSRLYLIFYFLLLIFIINANSDEVSESEPRDGQLTNESTRIIAENTTTTTTSSNITVFKRSLNCFTRRFRNGYRRICRKGHRNNVLRFENRISSPALYGKPANSHQNFVAFPYENGYGNGRHKYRFRWTHNNLQYFPHRHNRPTRPRWPPQRPKPPTKPSPGKPNGYYTPQPFDEIKRPKTVNSEYCGMRSYNALGGRIVGGRPAENKEFPWQVGLQEDEGDNNFEIRGGAVILSKRWVLTAAHVFVGQKDANNFRGVIGVTDLNKNGKYLKFDKLIKHEKYADEPGDFDNDIALLHTTTDIPLYPEDDYVNSICLPDIDEEFKGSVTVTGWGKTSEQGFETNQLMTVNIQVIDPQICAREYKQHFKQRIMICAGNIRGGKDSCSGDSGGPLIKRKPDNRWYLAGIVSFGGHQKCARRGSGASYAKVSKYVSWILNHMKQ